MEFKPFSKIPRLNRLCTITEKIDGTNGIIDIRPYIDSTVLGDLTLLTQVNGCEIRAGSRTRWITPQDDNFGFAAWVLANVEELLKLGPGTHYGEWWGGSIQRGYGIQEKRFSLFNTARWGDDAVRPACCYVVPVLYEGPFDTEVAGIIMDGLATVGSAASPGYMDPEGIVVFHHAANSMFKATIKGDEEGKHADAHLKKERPPRPPKDPSKGGRRKEQLPYEYSDRRKPR